jgi:hypothetical protein
MTATIAPPSPLRYLRLSASARRASRREFDNSTRYYLFTHLDFSIAHNQNNIIEVNVSADPLQRVDLGQAPPAPAPRLPRPRPRPRPRRARARARAREYLTSPLTFRVRLLSLSLQEARGPCPQTAPRAPWRRPR